jgi:hypothetical protein
MKLTGQLTGNVHIAPPLDPSLLVARARELADGAAEHCAANPRIASSTIIGQLAANARIMAAAIEKYHADRAALRLAARRALPYLISCIHEIACDHDDDAPCPAETNDEPVAQLRKAIEDTA